MAKELYQISYKTYLNPRVKRVIIRGRESFPLYVQITFDRQTTTLKSYYFDLFAQPKYDYLRVSFEQIEQLEMRAMDFITAKNAGSFSLDLFVREYAMFNKDVLDCLDMPFKEWLISYFQEEHFPGYATLLREGMQAVCALQLLDELKISLAPSLYQRLITKAAKHAPPYMPIAGYIRHIQPRGPFCLPLLEWIQQDRQADAEEFIYNEFHDYSMERILMAIKERLLPQGS